MLISQREKLCVSAIGRPRSEPSPFLGSRSIAAILLPRPGPPALADTAWRITATKAFTPPALTSVRARLPADILRRRRRVRVSQTLHYRMEQSETLTTNQ